jgi:hypothetical protein
MARGDRAARRRVWGASSGIGAKKSFPTLQTDQAILRNTKHDIESTQGAHASVYGKDPRLAAVFGSWQ